MAWQVYLRSYATKFVWKAPRLRRCVVASVRSPLVNAIALMLCTGMYRFESRLWCVARPGVASPVL